MEHIAVIVIAVGVSIGAAVEIYRFGANQYKAGWLDAIDAHEEWDEATE